MNTLHRAKQLQDRTKKFAIRAIEAFAQLPKLEATRIIGRQFLRSATSLAANYRSACRSRSSADFISKISVVSEETDETLFWLELLVDSQLVESNKLKPMMTECDELLRIFSASLTTAKRNR